ncbi:MAG: ATP-binding protein [Burkholderiales bacterium]
MNIRHGIMLFAIAGGGLFATLVSYDIWRDHTAAVEVASVRTRNLALALEEHTRQTLRRVELSLEAAADVVMRVSNSASNSGATLAEQLRAALHADGLIRAISVIDQDGWLDTSTRPGTVALTNGADRDYFIAHRERTDAGTFIGATVKSRIDDQWSLPVSTRRSNPDGSFAGVVVAFVEPAYFQRFYESIDTGINGFVTMFLRSGWIVVRKPFSEAVLARPWHDSPMFRVHLPNAESGMITQIVAATGIESLYSYRALKDYPVVVTVGLSLTDSLARWRAGLWVKGILLALAIAILFVGTRAMVRQLARNDAAQEGLRESEERFRQLAENIHEVFWMTDPAKNTMLYISPGYERIWGRTCASLYANPGEWFEAIHPADRVGMQAALAKQPAGTYDEQYRIVRPDGTNRWIRDRAFPVRAPDGEVYRVVGVAEDISERKHAEESRERLEIQLRQAQKMEAIGTLAGGVAHDFNNMLAAIIGNAELARHDITAGQSVAHNLDEIVTASLRAKGLVEQILAFSRQRPVERRLIDPRLVVHETVKLLGATIPSGIDVTTSIIEPVPSVLADATQLQQVLLNLGTNAWHSMERGGRITIELKGMPIDEQLVQAHPELPPGPGVQLTVRDTGQGMDALTLERIFDPFFTTKAAGKGTGLGLSVAHGVVRSHDGAIAVASSPGVGTTFDIYLPALKTDAVAPPSPGAVVTNLRGNGQRVLYIDDERALTLFATRALERLGYVVKAFTDATQALAALRSDPSSFDLVVTDYNMPLVSGVDVAVEAHKLRPDLPVMITSGYIDDNLRHEATRAGVRLFLEKPATINELGEAVFRLAHGYGNESANAMSSDRGTAIT